MYPIMCHWELHFYRVTDIIELDLVSHVPILRSTNAFAAFKIEWIDCISIRIVQSYILLVAIVEIHQFLFKIL